MTIKSNINTLIVSGLLLSSASVFAAKVDTAIPSYVKTAGVSGTLSSVGSDTLANMMTLWAEKFKGYYPSVNVQIQAAGSSTAPPALTAATSQFGPMSRQMKSKEIMAFEKTYGYKPTKIIVAIDALAVFVHKDNPIKGLSIADVDAIFSSTLKCGAKEEISDWGGLGLKGSWTQRDIQIFGRNSVSGTYGYFKKKALCKGDYKKNVNEQPGSASVVQSVSSSLNAIGYSGIGYRTSGVRAVAIAKKGTKYIEPSLENAANGKYPLSRYLYVYVNKHPNKPLSVMQTEFIKLMLSQQGQEIVSKDGYIPLSNKFIAKQLISLHIEN
ncbi:phosphate binding protein [Psychromonas sp. CNPT3]|uniref:PstS family phosphate ABC transporter substrate-binding protein n=1 Tax=Psychromonas sp. CNPT3 TaxID=314282 RepID=UPI0002C0D5DE|nr:phosphate ABC transporter substrate-binding protein PstS family protein [Psychromonas sp. CNPT3]AGH79996.1 phosphate binding protein [Psychromonas sp. CNPT3]